MRDAAARSSVIKEYSSCSLGSMPGGAQAGVDCVPRAARTSSTCSRVTPGNHSETHRPGAAFEVLEQTP